MTTSEVYIITCPSGKQYIGTTKKTLTDCLGFYIQKSTSNTTNLLCKELKLYNQKDIKIESLIICEPKDAYKYKVYFIDKYNTYTLENPDGLNESIQGNIDNLTKEVKDNISTGLKKYYANLTEKRILSSETKQKISNTLIDKTIRYDHNNNVLPKYMKYVNHKDRKGYQIVSHPNCKSISFVSSKKSLDQLYDDCLNYLNTL